MSDSEVAAILANRPKHHAPSAEEMRLRIDAEIEKGSRSLPMWHTNGLPVTVMPVEHDPRDYEPVVDDGQFIGYRFTGQP